MSPSSAALPPGDLATSRPPPSVALVADPAVGSRVEAQHRLPDPGQVPINQRVDRSGTTLHVSTTPASRRALTYSSEALAQDVRAGLPRPDPGRPATCRGRGRCDRSRDGFPPRAAGAPVRV